MEGMSVPYNGVTKGEVHGCVDPVLQAGDLTQQSICDGQLLRHSIQLHPVDQAPNLQCLLYLATEQ